MTELIKLGKRIYDCSNPREAHRMMVFLLRGGRHYRGMREMEQYFRQDELRSQILQRNPFPMEQVTRAFFYNKSTFRERKQLIQGHFDFLIDRLKPEWASRIGAGEPYEIWRSPEEDIDWHAILCMEPGQRKEGLLSVEMNLGEQHLYQIMFWLNADKNGEPALWIGAMQGPNMENAKDIVKEMTKRSFRYRTKNLILYMVMAAARSFGVKHIYAVSNEGYYANNHMRRDRKLKTDFGAFWEEAGGHVTADASFYELPLEETRKTMEEVPTRKRAVYRKRFEFQDDVDRQIRENMEKLLK